MMTYDYKLHAANIAALNAKHDAADAMLAKNETKHPAQESWQEYVKAKVQATANALSVKLPYAVLGKAA